VGNAFAPELRVNHLDSRDLILLSLYPCLGLLTAVRLSLAALPPCCVKMYRGEIDLLFTRITTRCNAVNVRSTPDVFTASWASKAHKHQLGRATTPFPSALTHGEITSCLRITALTQIQIEQKAA
jgi:hypothetical protein